MKFVVQFIKMTEKQSAVGRPIKDSVNKSIGVMNLPILEFLSYRNMMLLPAFSKIFNFIWFGLWICFALNAGMKVVDERTSDVPSYNTF